MPDDAEWLKRMLADSTPESVKEQRLKDQIAKGEADRQEAHDAGLRNAMREVYRYLVVFPDHYGEQFDLQPKDYEAAREAGELRLTGPNETSVVVTRDASGLAFVVDKRRHPGQLVRNGQTGRISFQGNHLLGGAFTSTRDAADLDEFMKDLVTTWRKRHKFMLPVNS